MCYYSRHNNVSHSIEKMFYADVAGGQQKKREFVSHGS